MHPYLPYHGLSIGANTSIGAPWFGLQALIVMKQSKQFSLIYGSYVVYHLFPMVVSIVHVCPLCYPQLP